MYIAFYTVAYIKIQRTSHVNRIIVTFTGTLSQMLHFKSFSLYLQISTSVGMVPYLSVPNRIFIISSVNKSGF